MSKPDPGSGTLGDTALRLRDLDDAQFRARYGCDRFTATVLRNRCRYVAAHMVSQVVTHAFSPVIREGFDICSMVSGPPETGYAMAAVSETMPLFYGSIPDAVRITMEEYGVENLKPGDVLIVNDYYRVGTHLNDAIVMRPVFHDDRIVAIVCIRAHFMDVGGIVMGGFDKVKRTTWEDGLRIPPMLFFSEGKPVRSTMNLLYDNTRVASLCVPDLLTEVQALEMGAQALEQSIERYGADALVGTVRYACDLSAEAMADGFRLLPDGVYEGEDWLDTDGLPNSPRYTVRVRITKVGDRVEVDLRGSSPPTRTAVNGAWPDIKTGVALALKSLLDPATPVTSGTLRNVDVVVPPSALFNVGPPLPCQNYFLVVYTLVHAVYRALNPALGERAIALGFTLGYPTGYGVRYDGNEGSLTDVGGPTIIGAWGATRDGDADSAQQFPSGNLVDPGAEVYEQTGAAMWMSSDYAPDSGGAGLHRGGAGILYDILWRVPAAHGMSMNVDANRPGGGVGGVYGGQAGPTTTGWLFADGSISDGGTTIPELPTTLESDLYLAAIPFSGMINPETHRYDPDGELIVVDDRIPGECGAIVRVINAGGGGWGDPLQRDPELVLRDVRDEYVSIEGAARDYGVVVNGEVRHPERMVVDEAATTELRASRIGDGAR